MQIKLCGKEDNVLQIEMGTACLEEKMKTCYNNRLNVNKTKLLAPFQGLHQGSMYLDVAYPTIMQLLPAVGINFFGKSLTSHMESP